MRFARCDLLDALPHYLGVSHADIWMLKSSIFVLRKRLAGNSLALGRLEAFYAKVTKVTDVDVDSELLVILSETGIDPGEAILAAMASNIDASCLITGDKRAIKALDKLESVAIRVSLAGKVLCFETLILEMIVKYGYDQIGPR